MKTIKIEGNDIQTLTTNRDVFLSCKEEGWQIATLIRDLAQPEGYTEQATFILQMEGSPSLRFTTRDLLSLPVILQNTKRLLEIGAQGNFDDVVTNDDVLECLNEVSHLISLFKKG